jgi:hypothetical protein
MQRSSMRRAVPSVARWFFGLGLALLAMSAVFEGISLARGDKPSCTLLAAGVNLDSLLGNDRAVATPADEQSCPADARSAVQTVSLTAASKSARSVAPR